MPLHDGDTILDGKYHIVRLIAEGGQSRVWLAEELTFARRPVVIKEPRPNLQPDVQDDVQLRYQREVQVCAALERAHTPNIVRAITTERYDGNVLLVLDYMAGGDVAGLIKQNPNGLPVEQAVAVARSVLPALQGAHEEDIVHRDVKPSNILLDDKGKAYLADFGVSQMPGLTEDRTHGEGRVHPGTTAYMAPEQHASRGYLTGAADLFALGCVLFEMLTGKRYKRLRPGTTAGGLRPDVPAWLDAVLAKALAEDPWARYDGAAAMAAAIEQGQAAEAKAKAETAARARADAQARARRAAEEQARRDAEARDRAEAEARRRAEHERARRQAEEDARRKAEEEERRHSLAEQARSWLMAGGALIVLVVVLALAARSWSSVTATPTATPVPPTATGRVIATPVPVTRTKGEATPSAVVSTPSARKTYSAPPAVAIDQNKNYAAVIATNRGIIRIQLLPKVAPIAVNNFVFLARDGFYDGLTFHRVEDWVVQGGDPTGTGAGGPGYALKAEFNATKHITGTVAMARTSDPDSAGSQFYIVKKEASWLDNQYTVFGQIIGGMDVVNNTTVGDIMQRITIEESLAAAPPSQATQLPDMVRVPAGEFLMGSADSDSQAYPDEKPQRRVYLDEFWIDKTEVTNAAYKKCVDAGKCKAPSYARSYTRSSYYGNAQYDRYPVIYVSWDAAVAYCAWAGKRLPSEAEWEKAGRGTDGRIYPWGNAWDGTRANTWDSSPRPGDTTAVGSYAAGASIYGALDMAGNVWEWVADWYDASYYQSVPTRNPQGPSSGQYRVVRGGGWDDYQARARSSARPFRLGRLVPFPSMVDYLVGLRCAMGSAP